MENILPWGRQRRLITGAIMAVVALAIAALLVSVMAGAWWFALVFVMEWLATMMLLQARDRT